MKVSVDTLWKLLDALGKKTWQSARDRVGLINISEKIGIVNSEYLYKKVYLELMKKNRKTLGLGNYQVGQILEFLGYNSLEAFEQSLALSPQLLSLKGCYYNYVRASVSTSTVLRSPAYIFERDGKLCFELRGKNIVLSGDVLLRNGCVFILMESAEEKSFYHVYKIGNRNKPNVLQGVFCGVSTAFDPIGGRTILVRQDDKAYTELTNRKATTDVLKKSSNPEEKKVAQYFKAHLNNTVIPGKSYSFELDDLD